MSEIPESEGSLIPAWVVALRLRARLPLRLLLQSKEQEPIPEPANRKVPDKRQDRSKIASPR